MLQAIAMTAPISNVAGTSDKWLSVRMTIRAM